MRLENIDAVGSEFLGGLEMANIKLGIAPIAWTNDDMPDLGKENTF